MDLSSAYSLLQRDRQQPMYDRKVHRLFARLFAENFSEIEDLRGKFIAAFHAWLLGSRLNKISGLDAFPDRDAIVGVTQFIDDLYQTRPGKIVVLANEYRYHQRLDPSLRPRSLETLAPGEELILSMPFPYLGDIHPDTNAILNRCAQLGIPVHIDSCWLGCSRDIDFNYDHPAIASAGFSLSKSLGLGANRIGVRYARKRWIGPVSILNDFNMTIHSLLWIGLRFMEELGPDFWQNKYGALYQEICAKLSLEPTKAIHLARERREDGSMGPVGVRPLLRLYGDSPGRISH